MHSRVLIELAALLASNGEVLLRGVERLSSSCIAEYWAASKCRIDRWARVIKSAEQSENVTSPGEEPSGARSPRPCLEEIITGEVLTRVWTGVVYGIEKRHQLDEASPVVRSVLLGHLEARRKTLRLLVSGRGVRTRDAIALNRLRRRTERWTDMLLGCLMPLHDVRDLAFDSTRAVNFADGLRGERGRTWGPQAWPIVFSSLRAAFLSDAASDSPNEGLNSRIASSVLGCFGSDLFDSTGQFQSLWQARLTYATSDTLGMIDQLICDESAAGSRSAAGQRPHNTGDGWRR